MQMHRIPPKTVRNASLKKTFLKQRLCFHLVASVTLKQAAFELSQATNGYTVG